MKTLYLIRHAEAVPAQGAEGDHARPLTDAGRKQAEDLGRFLKAQGIDGGLILSSDSRRTQETLDIATESGDIGAAVALNEIFYLASAEILRGAIMGMDNDIDTLAIVAHNPGLGEVAYALSPDAAQDIGGFPPAACTVFTSDAEDWALFDADAKLAAVHIP